MTTTTATSTALLTTVLPALSGDTIHDKETTLSATKKPAGKTIRVYGAILVQRGTPLFLGPMRAEDIVRQKKVDIYDPDTKAGYQREPNQSRMNEAGRYYQSGGRMPNPLLLNIREEDFARVTIKPLNDEESFNQAQIEGGNWYGYGYIEFPDDLSLWLFDGQHRGGGWDWVITQDPNDEYMLDFPVPTSIVLGLTDIEELTEFFNVNNYAKGVKTDLAWSLLHKRMQDDPELAELMEDKNQEWIGKGIDVVNLLKQTSPVWKDSIQLPNQKKVRSDRLTIPQAQFVRSLRPVLESKVLARRTPDEIAKVIDAYWQGVRLVLPDAFLDPKKYVLQKGPGAIALHRALPDVIEILRGRGKRLGDPDAYAEVLQGLRDLSGEVTTEDGVKRIKGVDYWLSGPEGVASQFTGDAGRKRLYVNVRNVLPKPTEAVEI